MAGGGIAGFFERWKTDWIDPALDYIEGGPRTGRSDSHLNDVSIEYSGEDVRAATRNFDPSCMLGSGTFGSVYKGTMVDGTEVAIKVLQVPEEAGFEEEVKVLSRFRHPNLVILMGFARHFETGGRSLIYEYLSGGDVSKRLQRSRQMSEQFQWRARLSAALDAACGLSHLHNMTPRAFHRDIKGPNILLDKNGGAKMADFGLSCVSAGAQHKVQQASGTVGYACPEYIRSGIITEGSEVHSFGMVLLELLTGAPPAVQRPDRPHEFCYLVDHLQGRAAKVIQMLDPTGQFPPALAESVTETAFRCIRPRPEERPLFKHLVEELRQMLQAADDTYAGAAPGAPGVPGAPAGQPAPGPWGPAAPAQPAPQAGVKRLMAGSSVECRWRGGTGWFPGRVARVNQDGTLAVRYSDGDFEDHVPAGCVRASEGSPVGSPVRGGSPGAPGRGRGSKDPADRVPSRGPPAAQQQRLGGASASPDARDRHRMASAASSDEGEQTVSARLWCVYAQGVELPQLTAQQRSLAFPQRGAELVVGRTAQPSAFWDTLVPDRRLHGTVSREHFRVIARRSHYSESGESREPSFYLQCMSLNGCLLNSRYLAQGSSERPLQHGDVVALAASTEPPSAQRSDVAPARKSFVVFAFETQCSSRAVPEASPPMPSPPQPPLAAPADDDEVQRPPAGTVVGRWRTSEAVTGVPNDAIFCLEAHGEHVREDLSAETRQLFFCCDTSEATLPSLRVGRHFQRGFWQRAVQPVFLASSRWAATLDVDHFDIRALRRSNPVSSEPPDYRFRLWVVGSSGVVLNYDALCSSGQELELGPGDTLTLGAPVPSGSSFGGSGAPGALPGLHLTFIPLAGALGIASPLGAAGLAPSQQPKPLPDLADEEGAGRAGAGVLLASAPQRAAGSLQPPPFFEAGAQRPRPPSPEPASQEGSGQPAAEGRAVDAQPTERQPQPMKTQMLAPIDLLEEEEEEEGKGDNLNAPDDLFARTGFRSPGAAAGCGTESLGAMDEAEPPRVTPPPRQLSGGPGRAARKGPPCFSNFAC